MPNQLDPHPIPIVSLWRPNSNTCIVRAEDYPLCNELLDICFCGPTIVDPPEVAKCVNDIVSRPWNPPPPADVGCNPVSLQISNRQDDTAAASMSLKGKINYIGGDACLPQIDLELITKSSFFSGGGSPTVRGWGLTLYGGIFRITPDSCAAYATPEAFFANADGAVGFLPKPNLDCNSSLPVCEFRQAYARLASKFSIIGPILAEITGTDGVLNTFQGPDSTVAAIPYAWRYKWYPAVCVIAANQCWGCPIAGWATYSENLPGAASAYCYNIKENHTGPTLTPGVDLNYTIGKGLKPQPLTQGTQVLVYGLIPWNSNSNGDATEQCNCELTWFVDVPNALAGECEEQGTSSPATSLMPFRSLTSAGTFFGIESNENRV